MVKITTYLGYEIHYDSEHKMFYAFKDGEIIDSEKTQEELEQFLKALTKKAFKRVPVIVRSSGYQVMLGEVTSFRKVRGYAGEEIQCRVQFKEGTDRTWRDMRLSDLCENTPENLAKANEILQIQKEANDLWYKAGVLAKEINSKLTFKRLMVLGGLEEEEGIKQ